MSVRKQTGPRRVHSTTHMYAMRTYFPKFSLSRLHLKCFREDRELVFSRTQLISFFWCPARREQIVGDNCGNCGKVNVKGTDECSVAGGHNIHLYPSHSHCRISHHISWVRNYPLILPRTFSVDLSFHL